LRDSSAEQVKKKHSKNIEKTTEEFANWALKNTKTQDLGSMILQLSSLSNIFLITLKSSEINFLRLLVLICDGEMLTRLPFKQSTYRVQQNGIV
jgi:hypothetical protein